MYNAQMISLIAAMSKNRVIGKDNQLPWHIPEDFQYFKEMTLEKPIIMGRKTFESIGRPLPKRRNIILTRDTHFETPGCEVFHTIEDVLKALKNEPEIMVIGGATIYEQFLPLADRIYLTEVNIDIEGDAFFPNLDPLTWNNPSVHSQKQSHPLTYQFLVFEK